MNRMIVGILAFFLLCPLAATADEYRRLHVTWDHEDPERTVAGFRIYHGNQVCDSFAADARSLDCEFLISGYPASFTATSYDVHGRESVHSKPYLLQQSASGLPVASISASPLSGPAPLPVQFDALDSLDAGGELSEFLWSFGDGVTASGETASHIYTAPGVYTVNLKVVNERGAEAETWIPITVHENTSTAAGFAFNFQPAEIQAPTGYVADSGSSFREMTGFGWTVPPADNPVAIARNSAHSPNPTFDTFLKVDPAAAWELDLPNGHYVVTVCAGDPAHPDGRQNVMVEGIPVIDNENLSSSSRWVEKAAHVQVIDRRLTLTFEGSVPHAKLAWLRVDRAENWKPALYLPRNKATKVSKPVKFAWSSSPSSSPHPASFSPVTYTLYYGTDPDFRSSAMIDTTGGSPGTGVLLAGIGFLGVIGLTIRQRRAVPFAALATAGAVAFLSSCGGGDGLPLAGGSPESRIIKNLETTTFVADDLRPATAYYWKIVADDGTAQVESEIFNFTTE